MKTIRVWFVGLVALGLLTAQVLPACALEITFTTEAAPVTVYINSVNLINHGVASCGMIPTINFKASGFIMIPFADTSGFQLYRASDNTPVSGSAGSVPMTADLSQGQIYFFTPSQSLDPNTGYYLAFANQGIDVATDTSGMNFTRISLDSSDSHNAQYWDSANAQYRLYFTTVGSLTASSADLGSGAVAPTTQQTGISVNATLKILMNNALDGTTVNNTNVVLREGSDTGTVVTTTTATLDTDNKTIIVANSVPLAYSTTYVLVISNVKDTAGQTLP